MTGGLFDPLGRDPSLRARRTARSAPVVVSAVVAALAVALLIVAALRDTGDRGEPRAVSTIERLQAPPPVTVPAVAAAPAPPPVAASPAPPIGSTARDDQEVEIQNGVRIIRPRRSGASTGQSVMVPVPAGPSAQPGRPGAAAP